MHAILMMLREGGDPSAVVVAAWPAGGKVSKILGPLVTHPCWRMAWAHPSWRTYGWAEYDQEGNISKPLIKISPLQLGCV